MVGNNRYEEISVFSRRAKCSNNLIVNHTHLISFDVNDRCLFISQFSRVFPGLLPRLESEFGKLLILFLFSVYILPNESLYNSF